MTASVLNRMIVAAGISAVVFIGLNVPADARPQHDQQGQAGQKQQKAGKKQDKQDKQQQQAQKKDQQQGRLALQDQQRLIRQQEQRLAQYRKHLDQRQRVAQRHSAQLQQQNRKAQYGFQQQYLARLRQQQLDIERQGRYDYNGDPYFYTPATYRYSRGGRDYETNKYGVDLLRQAVNYGYDEGHRAGLADQQDRWASNYEDSYAYQDANYGYGGFYVDRDDYNTYFREGFRRGYEDGFSGRSRYGSYSNGRGSIQSSVLSEILNFVTIR